MGRVALVPGSSREPRHQFLDWTASASGLTAGEHSATGFPFPTLRIVGDGSGSGGFAWRTYTFEVGQTSLFIRLFYEIENDFTIGSQGTILQLLNASDQVVGQLYITASSNNPHISQVRHGGSLITPYVGSTPVQRGVTKETWVAWKAASGPGANDGYWLVMGGHGGIYAIQRDWLNNDGTSATEQVRKIRIGWLASSTNPKGTIHVHEVEVWDGQPTDLDQVYPTADQKFFEDAPAIVSVNAPSGMGISSVTVGKVGYFPSSLAIIDVSAERTDATGNSDGVDDNGGLHSLLFNDTPGKYDGCLIEGTYGSHAMFPPAQIVWHRAEASNYKAHLHPIHPLCVTGPGKRGTLTTRTSDTAGTLTMESGHGIATGNTIHVYWDGGKRIGVTVGTVSGTSVPISGGSGDNLPDASTPMYVAYNNSSLNNVCVPARFRVWNAREWPAGSGRYVIGIPPAMMVVGQVEVKATIAGVPYTRTINVQPKQPNTLKATLPSGKAITVGCDDSLPSQMMYQRQVFAERSIKPYLATIYGGNSHRNTLPWAAIRLLDRCGWRAVPHYWDGSNIYNGPKALALRYIRIGLAVLRMQGLSDPAWMFVSPQGRVDATDDSDILDEILERALLSRGSTSGAHNNHPINLTTAQLASHSLYNNGATGLTPALQAASYLASKAGSMSANSLFSFNLHEAGPIYDATLTTRTSDTVGTLTISTAGHPFSGNLLTLMWNGGTRTSTGGTATGASQPISGGSGSILPAEGTAIRVGVQAHTDAALVAAILDVAQASYGMTPWTLRDYLLRSAGRRGGRLHLSSGLAL
ncbi:MAG: hypothetical protein IPM13_10320 [Phycisphaerales bacterium]|nr:hypothetical protein [Phycisphaerales bacterium]